MVVHVVSTTYYSSAPPSHVSQRGLKPSSSASSSTSFSSSSSSSSSASSALSYYTRLAQKSAPSGTVHLHHPVRYAHSTTTTRATTPPPPPLPPRPYAPYESRTRGLKRSNDGVKSMRSDGDGQVRDAGYEYVKKQVRFVDETMDGLGRR